MERIGKCIGDYFKSSMGISYFLTFWIKKHVGSGIQALFKRSGGQGKTIGKPMENTISISTKSMLKPVTKSNKRVRKVILGQKVDREPIHQLAFSVLCGHMQGMLGNPIEIMDSDDSLLPLERIVKLVNELNWFNGVSNQSNDFVNESSSGNDTFEILHK